MIDQLLLKEEAAKLNIILDETALNRFDAFARLLVEWNEKMNLTGITEPDEIVRKHFVDSLSILAYVELKKDAGLIDVGTGAGFPGLPLLIARPDLKVTFLDSLQKRLTFLEAVTEEIGLPAQFIHSRGEDAGRDPAYREQFDYATARAVASLPVLAEYCLPFVKEDGSFIVMKGRDSAEEQAAATKAIPLLGGSVVKSFRFTIKGVGSRNILVVKKISQTPAKYPRPSAKIAKKPL